MECPSYNDLRLKLFNRISEQYSDFQSLDVLDKFIFINMNSQADLGTYLCSALECRQNALFDTLHI